MEFNLPPQKEYVLYAPLSIRQREAYDRVLDGGLRKWLIHGGTEGDDIVKDMGVHDEENKTNLAESLPDKGKDDEDQEGENVQKPRMSKGSIKGERKCYNVDGDDDEYFEMLEQGRVDERGLKIVKTKEEEQDEARIRREYQTRAKGPAL